MNGRIVEEGNVISLVPSKVFSRQRLVVAIIVLGWCALLIAVLEVGDRAHIVSGGHRKNIGAEVILVTMVVVIFLRGGIFAARQKKRVPWIAVDGVARIVRLPRKGKEYAIDQIVRLQYVSFTHVGVSPRTLSYQGEPPWGELQIVVTSVGGELVECVGHFQVREAIHQFAIALRSATGIPVSRVYQTVSGDWHVEPFDGTEKQDPPVTT
jgi:hypothetical protein